jgi:hypothetical protein
MNYIDVLDKTVKEYFNLLEPNYPNWLNDYINTKEMLQQKHISITCGTIYSDLFESNFFFSSLDHSIAVALIVWHFTHDKKQTIAGLLHDIATPAFKHCVDYLRGDYMKQEATEDLTTEIISNSKEIMTLLRRDNIKLNEVDDYHLYTIADNDTPQLSADRLEYSLSNALITYRLMNIDDIKIIYDDICIQIDEQKKPEIGFQTEIIAEEFVRVTSKLSLIYREDRTRYSMQFIADILRRLKEDGLITLESLYYLKEEDVIKIIEQSKYADIFNKWKTARRILSSTSKPFTEYYINMPAKVRYINPLLNGVRISEKNHEAFNLIKTNLSYDMNNYVYLEDIFQSSFVKKPCK